MRIGIFAKTFPGQTPDAVLRATADAGYAVAQYNMHCSGLPAMPDAIPDPWAVARAARAAGVEIAAVSATYNMIHPDEAVRVEGHRRLGVIAAACRDMGTRLITLCTGTRDPKDQWRAHPDNADPAAWRDLCAAMEVALTHAEAQDADLGIEPELANVVRSAADAKRLIDEMQSDRLKIVLDPANLFETAPSDEQRRIVSEAIDLLADRIVMGHAKDRSPDGAFVTAGTGVLDYDHYLSELGRIGFAGPLVTHGLSAAEAPGVARFLRDKLADMR